MMLLFLILALKKKKKTQLLELSRCDAAQTCPVSGPWEHGPAQLCAGLSCHEGHGRAEGSWEVMRTGSRQAYAHPSLFLRAGLQPSYLRLPLVSCSSGLFLLLGEAQILSGGHVLSLPAAGLQDSGTYTCVASSAVGEDRREATLEVRCKYPRASPAPSHQRGGGVGGDAQDYGAAPLSPCKCVGLWGTSPGEGGVPK